MKKLSILALAVACSAPAFANTNFTGVSVGMELDVLEYKITNGGKRTTDANVVASYGIAHKNDFVSSFDVKAGVASPRINLNVPFKVEQRYSASVAYRLGYAGFHEKFLPYVKTSYEYIRLQDNESGVNDKEDLHGYGIGFGLKYMPVYNVELGAEYTRKKMDSSDYGMNTDLEIKSFTLGGAYRF